MTWTNNAIRLARDSPKGIFSLSFCIHAELEGGCCWLYFLIVCDAFVHAGIKSKEREQKISSLDNYYENWTQINTPGRRITRVVKFICAQIF